MSGRKQHKEKGKEPATKADEEDVEEVIADIIEKQNALLEHEDIDGETDVPSAAATAPWFESERRMYLEEIELLRGEIEALERTQEDVDVRRAHTRTSSSTTQNTNTTSSTSTSASTRTSEREHTHTHTHTHTNTRDVLADVDSTEDEERLRTEALRLASMGHDNLLERLLAQSGATFDAHTRSESESNSNQNNDERRNMARIMREMHGNTMITGIRFQHVETELTATTEDPNELPVRRYVVRGLARELVDFTVTFLVAENTRDHRWELTDAEVRVGPEFEAELTPLIQHFTGQARNITLFFTHLASYARAARRRMETLARLQERLGARRIRLPHGTVGTRNIHVVGWSAEREGEVEREGERGRERGERYGGGRGGAG